MEVFIVAIRTLHISSALTFLSSCSRIIYTHRHTHTHTHTHTICILLQECFNHSNVHIPVLDVSLFFLSVFTSKLDPNYNLVYKFNKYLFINFIVIHCQFARPHVLFILFGKLLKSKICVIYRPMHFKGRKP